VQVEESADEDVIRFDTAGVERMTISATGKVNIVGAGGHSIGGVAFAHVNLRLTGGLTPAGGQAAALDLAPQFSVSADGLQGFGLTGLAAGSLNTYNITKLAGLSFRTYVIGGPGAKTATQLIGSEPLVGMFGSGAKTITDMTAVKSGIAFASTTNSTITRWQEFWASYAGNSAVATHCGLRITDITAGTNKYLIWAGPNVPSATGLTNLRLDAGNPPNAASTTEGDSQLYLTFNENGTLVMRQLRWRQQNQLGATDKVLIAQ